jgi:uncharacterized protein YciI
MGHRTTNLGTGLLAFCLLATSAAAQDLPIPEEWSTHYAWFLVVNPEYSPGAQEAERAVTAAHIQYQLRLQENGQAIAAGGLGEGPGESIIGLTIIRAESLAEAKAIAAADPAVEAGRLIAWVREWWVPAERLP